MDRAGSGGDAGVPVTSIRELRVLQVRGSGSLLD